MSRTNSLGQREQVVVVGAYTKLHTARERAEQSLDELTSLVEAAGGDVDARVLQARDHGDSLGAGKLEEVQALCHAQAIDLVVFDGELTPSVQRQWEKVLGVRVVDRTEVILDIFAHRAASREGRLQVEMAQLSYLYPRLAGSGGRLSRQGGGIGTRGPGETRLEADRRRVRQRMAQMRVELEHLQRDRSLRRERRRQAAMPVLALVGYTNVGKSSLFQQLTKRLAPHEDALFVTLDPAVRRVFLPGFGGALLVDTVGFVSRLPHTLVAAFKATLDEVREASLILEVTNVASPVRAQQMAAVDDVLQEIGAKGVPRLLIDNQWDKMTGQSPSAAGGFPVSALTGYNVDALVVAVSAALAAERPASTVFVPWSATEIVGWIKAEGDIVSQASEEAGIRVEFRAPPHVAARVFRRLS